MASPRLISKFPNSEILKLCASDDIVDELLFIIICFFQSTEKYIHIDGYIYITSKYNSTYKYYLVHTE